MSVEIRTGNLFRLGDHRLIAGDARNPEAIAKLVGEEKVAQILTDPPYGVAVVESKTGFSQAKGKHRVIANDHLQSEEEYRTFCQEWLTAAKPYLTEKNSAYIFNSDRMIFSLHDAIRQSGFHFSQLLVWVKTQAVIGRMDYLSQHELIAYGWLGRRKFRHSKNKSVIVHPKTAKNTLHPTMKPVGLLRKLILNGTELHDIVYDPFAGSGSTLIAAVQTKRKCFAVECDLEYCRKIIKRWEKLTGLRAQKLT